MFKLFKKKAVPTEINEPGPVGVMMKSGFQKIENVSYIWAEGGIIYFTDSEENILFIDPVDNVFCIEPVKK